MCTQGSRSRAPRLPTTPPARVGRVPASAEHDRPAAPGSRGHIPMSDVGASDLAAARSRSRGPLSASSIAERGRRPTTCSLPRAEACYGSPVFSRISRLLPGNSSLSRWSARPATRRAAHQVSGSERVLARHRPGSGSSRRLFGPSKAPTQGEQQISIVSVKPPCHCEQFRFPRLNFAVEIAYTNERDVVHVEAVVRMAHRAEPAPHWRPAHLAALAQGQRGIEVLLSKRTSDLVARVGCGGPCQRGANCSSSKVQQLPGCERPID